MFNDLIDIPGSGGKKGHIVRYLNELRKINNNTSKHSCTFSFPLSLTDTLKPGLCPQDKA